MKETRELTSANSACVEYCEHRIEEAKEKLKENNMRHGYLRLAEVLKKEHMSEKHKKLENISLDILITYIGRSIYPGTCKLDLKFTVIKFLAVRYTRYLSLC